MRRAAMLALVLAACGDRDFAFLIPDDVQSVVVARIGEGETVTLRAYTRASADLGFTFRSGDGEDVMLLLYVLDLEALGLPAQPEVLEQGRPLPRPDVRYNFEGGTFVRLATPVLDGALARVRIAISSFVDCAREDGCITTPQNPTCTLPCPELEPPLEAPMQPDLPELPDSPSLQLDGACAGDWAAEEHGGLGLTICRPPEPAGWVTCPPGQHRFRGELACTPLGAICPADGVFPAPEGRNPIHVDAAAAAGGDGTSGRPFARIEDALQGSTPGDVLLLAGGTPYFEGELTIPDGVWVTGACAERVIIDSPRVHVTGSGVSLRDLTLRSTSPSVHSTLEIADNAAAVTAEALAVYEGDRTGIYAHGAGVELHRVHVRRPSGYGVVLRYGRARVDQVAVESSTISGVLVDFGARAEITRLDVRSTRVDVEAGGVLVGSTATATITDVVVEGVSVGLAFQERSRGLVRDATIRDSTRARSLGVFSAGVVALQRVHVANVRANGIAIHESNAELSDVVIERLTETSTETGAGLAVQSSTVVARRVRIEQVHTGISSLHSRLHLEDVVVKDALHRAPYDEDDRNAAFGIHLSGTSSVDRVLVADTGAAGLWTVGSFDGRSVTVRAAGQEACASITCWLRQSIIGNDAEDWSLRRALIEDANTNAIALDRTRGVAEVLVEDVTINRVSPLLPAVTYATAILAVMPSLGTGAHPLRIHRVSSASAYPQALLVLGGRVIVEHVQVDGLSDNDRQSGHAALHFQGTRADVKNVAMKRVEWGVVSEDGAEVDVEDATIDDATGFERVAIHAKDAFIDLERARITGDFAIGLRAGLDAIARFNPRLAAREIVVSGPDVAVEIRHGLDLARFSLEACTVAFKDHNESSNFPVSIESGAVTDCTHGVERHGETDRRMDAFLRNVRFEGVSEPFVDLFGE